MIRPWWALRKLYKRVCLKLPFIMVVEYCRRCGTEVSQIWWSPGWLWEDITGELDGAGIRCIRCFDVEAQRRGIHLQWVPRLCPGFHEATDKERCDEA
jgi:hypothetical protein